MRATSATRAPPCENACASNRPSPRPAPVITTRFPVTSARTANDAGISICSAIALPCLQSAPARQLYRPVQYIAHVHERRPARDAPADARDPRLRGARRRARTATARYPGFVHLSIGQEASAVGACWPLRPDRRHHVDAPRPRPLPREGPRPARDVRRADGQGRRARTAAAADRCTSPTRRSASSAPTGSWPPACRSRWAPRPRRSCERDGSVAVAFFGDGAVAHGTFHEAVNLAAVWQLPVIFFCENNGYAEFSPAVDPARGAARARVPRATASTTSRSTATTSWRPRPRCSDGRRRSRAPDAVRSIVEADTYRWHGHYEGDPERYRSPDEVREWEARDPLLVHAAGSDPRASPTTTLEAHASRRSRTSSTTPSRRPGDCRRRRPRTLTDFVAPPAARRGPNRRAPPADAPVFRTMDAIRAALEAELADDERVFVAGIDVARRRQRVRPDARAARPVRRSRPRHARSPRPRSSASASAPRWRACARSSS